MTGLLEKKVAVVTAKLRGCGVEAESVRLDVADIPLRRLGTPRDVADAALYLASGLSDYVTGMTIDVNGGMFMR